MLDEVAKDREAAAGDVAAIVGASRYWQRAGADGSGRDGRPEPAVACEADVGPDRLPRRAGRDRPELLLPRGRRPHPARRLRDHVPRRRHARRRPRPARLHVPARERRSGRGGPPHPRARGPRRRPRVPAPRHLGPDLRLGAVARAGPQPHRGSGHARPHRARSRSPTASGAASVRSTASSSRSRTRCRTVSRSRSSRPRARSSTPATSSSTSRRSTVATPTSRCSASIARRDGGVRLLLSDSTNAERPGLHAVGVDGRRGDARRSFREHADKRFIVASFASHLHRVEQVAQAAIAHGRKIAFVGRSMVQNVAMARERGFIDVPAYAVIDIEEAAKLRARRGVHRLHRFAGRADERAVADGRARAQVREDLARRRRRDQRARDPGQRVERVARHRLAAPRRRRGRARPHVAGARVGSRVAGRAEVRAQPALARVVRARCTASTATSCTTRSSRATSASPPTACSSARTATSSRSAPTAPTSNGARCRPGYMYVDGIVGDVGHGVLRDRRMLSEEGVVVVIVTVDAADRRDRRPGPRSSRAAGSTRPRPRICSRTRSRSCATAIDERGRARAPTDFETMRRHARKSLGRFIDERTRRRPIVIPVVMEV